MLSVELPEPPLIEAGLKVAVAPEGRPFMLRVTFPVKPPEGRSFVVYDTDLPAIKV
jgi:hypothetical protein